MAKVRGSVTPPAKGRGTRKGGSPARKASAAARAPEAAARARVPVARGTQPSGLPIRIPVAVPVAPISVVAMDAGEMITLKRPGEEPPPPMDSEETTAKRGEGAPRAMKSEERQPPSQGQLMELHWGDSPPPPSSPADGLVQRWVKRGDALLRHLAEHGAARHEYRADLKEGRFVWVSPEGRISAEAEAQVICSYATTTSVIAMGWIDPLIRSVAIPRLDGMASELDNIDEEAAWRVAMQAAELSRAEYLYRVMTPHAWYFLALRKLSFTPVRASFHPGTPVGLVLQNLVETRRAIESRAEPTEVVRARLAGVGQALLKESSYAYRGTDWVARLERTGRCLSNLSERLPRESFNSVAAGRYVEEWLDREATIELSQSLTLLEDEWALFV